MVEEQRKGRSVDELAAEIDNLRVENGTLRAEIDVFRAENERLEQQIAMLKKAVFGQKSEKRILHSTENPDRLSMFNEAETEARREEAEEVTVPAHKRRKKRSRAEILGELPVEEVIHEVEDRICDRCGSEMKTIGKEFVHDELVYERARLFIRKHYVEVVKCTSCGKDESKDAELDDIEKEYNNVSSEVYEIFNVTGFTQILKVSRAIREVSVEGCQLIGKGGNGSVYRIDAETIVKVFNEGKTLDYVKKSRETAQTAFVHGIPCAISYDVVKVGNCYGVVYELLNVRTLGRTIHSEPEKAEYWAEKAASLLRKLHSTEFDDGIFGQASESVKGWVKTVEDKIAPDDAARLYRAIDNIAVKRKSFVHEDFHSNNIMVQGDELLLIDVDDACVGDPAVDLAGMYITHDITSASDETSMWVLGMNAAESKRYWTRFKEVYFDGMDEKEIAALTFRMKFFGNIKFLYGIMKTDRELSVDRNVLSQQIMGGLKQMMDAVGM